MMKGKVKQQRNQLDNRLRSRRDFLYVTETGDFLALYETDTYEYCALFLHQKKKYVFQSTSPKYFWYTKDKYNVSGRQEARDLYDGICSVRGDVKWKEKTVPVKEEYFTGWNRVSHNLLKPIRWARRVM